MARPPDVSVPPLLAAQPMRSCALRWRDIIDWRLGPVGRICTGGRRRYITLYDNSPPPAVTARSAQMRCGMGSLVLVIPNGTLVAEACWIRRENSISPVRR